MCSLIMVSNNSDNAIEKQYSNLLFQGGLTVASSQMVDLVFVFFFLYLIMQINLLQYLMNPL